MILNMEDYRNKVLGCWMGKNIGGTLGAPFEWKRQVNDVSFYTQKLDGNPLPNDDLDIQLLWLIAMEEKGIGINAKLLSEYWNMYVTPHWSEYGTAKINIRAGLLPPNCGTEDNEFKDSCGAFIRSEIWACIAPGSPETAARYAYEDAIIDHGNGEGVYGEIFCAALESAAFVERDIFKLIDIGLSYIPDDCGVTLAARSAVESYKIGKTWLEARNVILDRYRGKCFFSRLDSVSAEDVERGFADGKLGWDVPSNIGMLIIGLLYGEHDFGKSLCIAVNCGEDTDCTAATLGSILGILNGIDAIPEKWKKPIGRSIKTACLNLGELGYFGDQLPGDIDNLTYRVERICRQVILGHHLPLELSQEKAASLSDEERNKLYAGGEIKKALSRLNGPVFSFDFFDVYVDYGNDAFVKSKIPKCIKLTIENKYKVPAFMNIHWYSENNWSISPAADGNVHIQAPWRGGAKELEFVLETEKVEQSKNRFAVELTIDGRNTVMLIPIILMNGDLR